MLLKRALLSLIVVEITSIHIALGANITVNNGEELQTTLNNASPGDVIILGPETFTGTFTAAVNGSEDAPITVIPVDEKCKIVGSGENETCFEVTGSYWVLKNLAISDYELAVLITGTKNILNAVAISNVTRGIQVEGENNSLDSCALSTMQDGIILKANKTILTANSINATNYSLITEENTCCGRISANSISGGITELRGSDYVLDTNVIKGDLTVSGCGNTFQSEVDVAPEYLTKCDNPDLGGNMFV